MLIDFTEPVAILCVSVLHFITDDEDPRQIMAALRWRLAPGSFLAISHAASDRANQQVLAEIGDVYAEATAPAVPRTEAQIRDLMESLDLVEPGLVDVSQWRPDRRGWPTRIRLLAAVGRKPEDASKQLHRVRALARPPVPEQEERNHSHDTPYQPVDVG